MKRRFLLLLALPLAACISKAEHERVLKDATDEKGRMAAAMAQLGQQKQACDGEMAKLQEQLKKLETAAEERETKLTELTTARHNAQAALDEATAINQQLRGELERLGKDVDKILKEKGTLTKALDDAKSRLDELRRAQSAAEARTALFQQLQTRFKKMIDAGFLQVAIRDKRFVMTLPVDQLFDPGRAEIRPSGDGPLLEIANTLRTLDKRRFEIAGHTDDVPIKTTRFTSNWDLSAARAVEVVKQLVKHGVKPGILGAAAYGEFSPIAPNDTAQNKAKNRRIEIVLEPGTDELITPQ